MSSPPNLATSPPLPHLTLPKKRPSLATGAPDSKRRKPSLATPNALHPLRQTSFPPPANAGAHSPNSAVASRVVRASREGSVSSLGGRGSVAGRGRKGKRAAADARSTTGASATGTTTAGGKTGSSSVADGQGSLVGGRAGKGEEDEDGEEVEEEPDGPVDTVLEGGGMMDEAAEKQASEHLDMLVRAFRGDQEHRYAVWRRVKLKKEILRRLVNQTLSQSVPQSIITTVNGYTKIFIGELIDRARDVQDEWLAASPTLPTGGPNVGNLAVEASTSAASGNPHQEGHTDVNVVHERDRGPLTPDHLREALRRYKKDRDGGGVGFQGLSLQGKQAVAFRAGGKRLFR